MTTATLHLLTLPREIRNRIYYYLSHNIKFEWRWNYWPLSGADGISQVCLENASSVSVLLACTQLYDEYRESCSIRQLAVTINVNLGSEEFYRRDDARHRGLIDKILPQTSRLVILVCNRRRGESTAGHFWFEVYLLSQVLADRSPHLKTLHISVYALPSPPSDQSRLDRAVPNESSQQVFVPPPYESLNGLPLVRHVNGPRHGYHSGITEDTANNELIDIGHDHVNSRLHGLTLVGEWLYMNAKVEKHTLA